MEATEQLVKSPGINIEEVDEQKLTALHMACVFGNLQCARLVEDIICYENILLF